MNTPQLATQREAIHFAIKAMFDANPNAVINRLVEIALKHDTSGIMLDVILKGMAVGVEIVDDDKLRDSACRVFGIQPFEYAGASARLGDSCIKLDVKYQCGVDENGIDRIYDHKEITVRFEDEGTWGIRVLYI